MRPLILVLAFGVLMLVPRSSLAFTQEQEQFVDVVHDMAFPLKVQINRIRDDVCPRTSQPLVCHLKYSEAREIISKSIEPAMVQQLQYDVAGKIKEAEETQKIIDANFERLDQTLVQLNVQFAK